MFLNKILINEHRFKFMTLKTYVLLNGKATSLINFLCGVSLDRQYLLIKIKILFYYSVNVSSAIISFTFISPFKTKTQKVSQTKLLNYT